jgi:hypothetical protein
MAKFGYGAAQAGADVFPLAKHVRKDTRDRLQSGLLLAACALLAAALLMPSAAQAVECSNGGARTNPAGADKR